MGKTKPTVTIPFTTDGKPVFEFKNYEVQDNSLIILNTETPYPAQKKKFIQDTLEEKLKKVFGLEHIAVLITDGNKSFHQVKPIDGSILLFNQNGKFLSPHNSEMILENTQSMLEKIGMKERIGILVVAEPMDVQLMDENTLLEMGLVKLTHLEEKLGDKELEKFMTAMGYEKLKTGDRLPEPIVSDTVGEVPVEKRKFVVHSNDDYSFNYLCKAYGIEPAFAIDSHDPRLKGKNEQEFYHLYPRLDGKWNLPDNTGR